MLPNKSSKRGVIKSAVVFIIWKMEHVFWGWGFCLVVGIVLFVWKKGEREMKWIGAPFQEQKVVG